MSLKGQISCARCKAFLFEEDDIVYCPECGAPHHRDCYSSLGHCALENLHGTKDEYKKPEVDSEIEPKTEKTNTPPYPQFATFDFLGGIPADYTFEENITADEVKKFVLTNSHRYVPKFVQLNSSNKVSWNWAAFLFPCGWMLSRKMHKNGIIAVFLTIIASLLSYPLSISLTNLGLTEIENSAELISKFYEAMPKISVYILIFALLGMLLEIGIRIFSALFGDYIYKKHCIKTIKDIKSNDEDIAYSFQKRGGVSLLLLLVGFFAVEYIPLIIFSFL